MPFLVDYISPIANFTEAAKHLLGAYELRPNLPYVAGDLGYLYLLSGEIQLARKFLRLANRLQPSERNIISASSRSPSSSTETSSRLPSCLGQALN